MKAMRDMLKLSEEPQEFKEMLKHIMELNNTPGEQLKADENAGFDPTPNLSKRRNKGRKDHD